MRRDALTLRPLLALVAIAGLVTLLTACGSSKSSASNTTQTLAHSDYKAEAELKPPAQAPPLALRNYLGKSVNLDAYRGKAALVTFIYTHCPDVCPLITSNLRVAQNLMGPEVASKVQIIAVSVDSRGDTKKTVTRFLAQHEMTGRMQYLIGSTPELARVWKAWGVGSQRDAKQPDLVEHSGLIFGISASGKRTTLYSASFKPADIAHDVPLLAKS
jgi:protein SCO1/2